MAWLFLIIGGAGEVIGVAGIGQVNKNKSIRAFALLFGGFIMSFFFLSLAMESLPMSTSYAVWTGIGTIGSALVGMSLYGESTDWRRLLFILMILAAAVGLKILS